MDIEKEIMEVGHTVIKFYADWCGPCRMMNPIMSKVAERDDVKVVPVNVDEESEIASKYGINSIPTLIFYKDGQLVGTNVGIMLPESVDSALAGTYKFT